MFLYFSCYKLTSFTKSSFPSCYHDNITESASFLSQEVLVHYGIDQPFWFYFIPLFAILIGFRVVGYLLLRFYQKPH